MISNEVLKAKLRVLASVKMQNLYFQKALIRKSNIEKTLRSKLLRQNNNNNKNNSMIKKLTQENLSLKQGSHHSEAKQLTYWKTDEVEEDGENFTMTKYGLLADYIAGDLN